MKKIKFSFSNIVFVGLLILLIIPQTRLPIQVLVNRIRVALFSPSTIEMAEQARVRPFTYEVTALDGSPIAFEIGNGRITFLSYWATWCPPCIAELPSIQELYKDYGHAVDFVLLTKENQATVRLFLDKKGFEVPAVIPRTQTPTGLEESTIPTNYIIGKTGRIIVKEQGASNWNSRTVRETLDTLLAE